MQFYLNVAQIAVSALLIATILMQARGSGLSAAFGGEGNVYRTKRGAERALYIGTIVLSVLFFATALAAIILKR